MKLFTFFAVTILAFVEIAHGKQSEVQLDIDKLTSEFLNLNIDDVKKEANEENIDILFDEFKDWASSSSGSAAIKNDFFDTDASLDENLIRFSDSLERKENIEKTQEEAKFSLNNSLALLKEDEFQKLNGFNVDLEPKDNPEDSEDNRRNLRPASEWENIDWRKGEKGHCVPPVKHQKECGACWAFSTIAALEIAYCVKNEKSIDLPEQYLLNCDSINDGCGGGSMIGSFDWIKKNNNGNLCSVSEAGEYTGVVGSCVKCDSLNLGLEGRKTLRNEQDIYDALKEYPVTAGVFTDATFQYYDSGILHPIPSNRPNHAILVVGYQNDDDGGYWIVRNSYGRTWGEDGYFRLRRTGTGLYSGCIPVM